MSSTIQPSTFTVSVFTRHSPECKQRTDPQYRRCDCRKYLYIYESGKDRYVSARTRSWSKAEEMAQAEKDARDPVKIRLKEIEAAEQSKREAEKQGHKAITEALDEWTAGIKDRSYSRMIVIRAHARKIKRWAEREKISYLHEITPRHLYVWRGQWGPDAEHKDDRMASGTQRNLMGDIRLFLRWAKAMKYITTDPTEDIQRPRAKSKQTRPLTMEQFSALIAATYKMDEGRKKDDQAMTGRDLRAIFLLQRWRGLRIQDALLLRRTDIKSGEIDIITQKRKARLTGPIHPEALAALDELSVDRSYVDARYYFWSGKSKPRSITIMWLNKIDALRKYLRFTDEHGVPFKFRSHMLRDTFAVQLLLQGVPMEEVSRLLTHKSIKTTEEYYAPWVPEREALLKRNFLAAMQRMGATNAQD